MKCFLLVITVFGLLSGACLADALRLQIEVDQAELEPMLQEAIVLPAALTGGDPINRRWLHHYQKQLPGLVNQSLEPYGYFHSQTETRVEETSTGDQLLHLRVSVGAPVIISSLSLELVGPGADLPELQKALKLFPLSKGELLRQDLYEQGKALLLREVEDQGFLDAQFGTHQLLVYRAEDRADIILQLDTGTRYVFGQTTFLGESGYPERFLRRYLSYKEGEIFAHRQLGQTQLNLLNADLFHQVKVSPADRSPEDNSLPVQIELQPAPRHQLRFGFGYGTDTGARGSLRYRELNLFQQGHELKGDLLLAERKQSLVTTYILPDLSRLDSQTQLRIGFDREESDSYLSRELFTEAEYQRAFGGNLIGSLFLRLTQEFSEIGLEQTRSQMLLPGVRLQWHQVDDPVLSTYGLQGNIEIKGAEQALLSDTSLLQLTGQATSLFPLPGNFYGLFRLQGGTTWHNDPLRELPASLRFFAGGNRSVRGYAYQSLGPKDTSGQIVGGKNLLVANFELEKRFGQKWGGAIFYDLGNAFDSFAEYELEQGAGLGVRRYTAIGPIRVDLARQVGNNRQRWRLHLSMGFGW